MPRVVPSQVVAVIDRLWPWAKDQADTPQGRQAVDVGHSPRVTAMLDLLAQIPSDLFALDVEDYAALVTAAGVLRDATEQWRQRGDVLTLHVVPGYSHLNPITMIRRALARCPDEVPTSATAGLTFITDDQLRESLRRDISAAERAFSDGGWKAATVLAGSVVEALLLWALQQESAANISHACAALLGNKTLKSKPDAAHLENWVLHEYAEVGAELDAIEADTASLVRLTKDYRNLIHPGRAQRLGQVCDRGTARTALAAVDAVVRDLT